jgi:hypothetical protein
MLDTTKIHTNTMMMAPGQRPVSVGVGRKSNVINEPSGEIKNPNLDRATLWKENTHRRNPTRRDFNGNLIQSTSDLPPIVAVENPDSGTLQPTAMDKLNAFCIQAFHGLESFTRAAIAAVVDASHVLVEKIHEATAPAPVAPTTTPEPAVTERNSHEGEGTSTVSLDHTVSTEVVTSALQEPPITVDEAETSKTVVVTETVTTSTTLTSPEKVDEKQEPVSTTIVKEETAIETTKTEPVPVTDEVKEEVTKADPTVVEIPSAKEETKIEPTTASPSVKDGETVENVTLTS